MCTNNSCENIRFIESNEAENGVQLGSIKQRDVQLRASRWFMSGYYADAEIAKKRSCWVFEGVVRRVFFFACFGDQ